MKAGVKIGLWLVIIILSYAVYNSITSKIAFEYETKRRRDMVIERLKDIRIAQLAYKSVNEKYAKNLIKFSNEKNSTRPRIIRRMFKYEN